MLVASHNTILNEVVQYLKPFSYWITFITSPIPRSSKFRCGVQIVVHRMKDLDRAYVRKVWPLLDIVTYGTETQITLWLL